MLLITYFTDIHIATLTETRDHMHATPRPLIHISHTHTQNTHTHTHSQDTHTNSQDTHTHITTSKHNYTNHLLTTPISFVSFVPFSQIFIHCFSLSYITFNFNLLCISFGIKRTGAL